MTRPSEVEKTEPTGKVAGEALKTEGRREKQTVTLASEAQAAAGPAVVQTACEWKTAVRRAGADGEAQKRRLDIEKWQLTDEEQGQTATQQEKRDARQDPALAAAREKMVEMKE